MKRVKFIKLFAVLMIVLSATMGAQNKYEKEFDVKAKQKLTIDLETGASIYIKGWDKNKVSADVEVRGRSADDIDFEFEKTPGGVLITSEYHGWNKSYNSHGELKIMVPNQFDVEFKTMGGDVEFNEVEGRLEGVTMGGELTLKNLKGYLNMKTMGGSIELTDSEVDGNVETMGGTVLVENVVGDVDASSMGGNIVQRNVKSSSKSVGKEVDVHTMGGGIDVDEALYGANVKTMGGEITINKVKEYLKAETMGGDIYVKEADAWVKAKTMGGDVEVKLNCDPSASDRDVELVSMHGDIILYVPSDFSMKVDIEIKYSEEDEDDVDIISDFNVHEEVTNDRERHHWDITKTLHGTASFNGGKNRVKIRTVNGRVYLKKI